MYILKWHSFIFRWRRPLARSVESCQCGAEINTSVPHFANEKKFNIVYKAHKKWHSILQIAASHRYLADSPDGNWRRGKDWLIPELMVACPVKTMHPRHHASWLVALRPYMDIFRKVFFLQVATTAATLVVQVNRTYLFIISKGHCSPSWIHCSK